MRRVVVTGIGLVTPLGCGAEITWSRLIAGQSGLRRIDVFDASDLPAQVAGIVPGGMSADGGFDVQEWVAIKEQKKMDRFIHLAMAAAQHAIEDSGWKPTDNEALCRTGVMIGAGIGGLEGIHDTAITLHTEGPRRVSPFFIPACLINLAAGQVSIRYGFKGPNHSTVTACSSGAHAIGDAARIIQWDDADVMVAGGAESAVCRIGIAGFAAARALSTHFNDQPTKASRPWDKDRDGFVMGEGAGIVVLEELEHARRRGAKIYAEVVGYGLSGDAYHMTSPSEDGDGAYRAMKAAVKRSGLALSDIGYINAHATSTPVGDTVELRAMERLFEGESKLPLVSSTKSAIGHLLGAAGSVESIFSILALRDQVVPPTLNLDHPPENVKFDLVPHQAKKSSLKAVLSNSFGFGGTNASLVFQGPPSTNNLRG